MGTITDQHREIWHRGSEVWMGGRRRVLYTDVGHAPSLLDTVTYASAFRSSSQGRHATPVSASRLQNRACNMWVIGSAGSKVSCFGEVMLWTLGATVLHAMVSIPEKRQGSPSITGARTFPSTSSRMRCHARRTLKSSYLVIGTAIADFHAHGHCWYIAQISGAGRC